MAKDTRPEDGIAPDPWRFQRWAYSQQVGGVARKAVLMTLAIMADAGSGRCEAKQATLAQAVELTERSVREHLLALCRAGLITRRPQFRQDGRRRGDEFLLLAPGVEEWPDGQPADSSGGEKHRRKQASGHERKQSSGHNRKQASGQELPLRNDHSKNGRHHHQEERAREAPVPEEMLRDAAALLNAKKKVDGRVVTEAEMMTAAAALAEFNRQADSDFGLGANVTPIVMRIRERPSWDAAKHVRLVQSAWRLRWWEKRNGSSRRATPQVVYGNARVFEQVAQDARNECEAAKALDSDRDLRGKVWPDGTRFEDLTPGAQAQARRAVEMGLKPWLPQEEQQRPQVNGTIAPGALV